MLQFAGGIAAIVHESPRLCCGSHSHASGDISVVRSPENRGTRHEHHEIECRNAGNRTRVTGADRRYTHAIASRLAAGRLGYRNGRQRGLDRPSRVRAFQALLRRNASERRGASIAAGPAPFMQIVAELRKEYDLAE
jgi:hypothetical protein